MPPQTPIVFDPSYARDGMGWLHWAVWNRCGEEVFVWLLKHGARPEDVTTLGLNATEYALSRGHHEAVVVLWPILPTDRWAWALYLDASSKNASRRNAALRYLLGLDPSMANKASQGSPLFWAAMRKDAVGWKMLDGAGAKMDECTRQLLTQSGADPAWRQIALEQAWVSVETPPRVVRL